MTNTSTCSYRYESRSAILLTFCGTYRDLECCQRSLFLCPSERRVNWDFASPSCSPGRGGEGRGGEGRGGEGRGGEGRGGEGRGGEGRGGEGRGGEGRGGEGRGGEGRGGRS